MKISFFVSGVPVPRQSVRFARDGHAYQPRDRAAVWKGLVRVAALKARPPRPWEGPVKVKIFFSLPQPKARKGWSPITRPDLDNLEKPLFDAINGVIYRDDSQIVLKLSGKEYAAPGSDPGVSIEIEEI